MNFGFMDVVLLHIRHNMFRPLCGHLQVGVNKNKNKIKMCLNQSTVGVSIVRDQLTVLTVSSLTSLDHNSSHAFSMYITTRTPHIS
jgi:hypothetical protein